MKLDRARELIQQAIDSAPTNGAYQDSLGWLYYQQGKYEAAYYHLQLATLLLEEKESQDPIVYDHLGDALLKLNKPAGALQAYRRASLLLEKMEGHDGVGGLDEHRALKESITKKIEALIRTDGERDESNG